MDGQEAIIAAEQTGLRFVADAPDAFGFLYSFTQTGPFATTALVVLGAHKERARELAGQLNHLLSASSSGARKVLTAGDSLSWRVGEAPGGGALCQMALLVEPTPAARQRLLADFVTEQSGAFAGAGQAARVLLLVPLLRSEARAMCCARGGPERSALHSSLAQELAGALQVDPPAHWLPRRAARV